jgi:hypothetical protein
MTCRDYQHQISLLMYDELSDIDKTSLETHLLSCDNCRQVFEEEKGFNAFMAEDALAVEIPSDLLVQSRRELANELDRLEKNRSWWRLPAFAGVFTPMRLLESAALVAMGLALGVYVSNQRTPQQVAATPAVQESKVISAIPENSSVSNLRIVTANASTGQVELAGEVVQPIRMQGTLGDETVQQLLVSALAGSSNSGSRLRAAEILAPRAGDETVKSALIQALIYDDNPSVRLRAMQGLKQYAGQGDVREAFMHSLKSDLDAGIRFEAIEALTTRNSNDAALRKALEPFTQDDNAYVKMKALQFVGTNQ